MTYAQALHYLNSFPDFERLSAYAASREFNLERMRWLLRRFGNPEKQFRSVLIAGTKGKGSTACFLESILRANGIRTGLYTSPHLFDFRERIRTNGCLISPKSFSELLRQVRSVLKSKSVGYTFFEISTLLALLYFADQKVEWAVLEAGMGGRLDATNAVSQSLSIFTLIGRDHEEHLGPTIKRIAKEKAGIMKHGVPFLSIQQPKDASAVLRSATRRCRTKGRVCGADFTFRGRECTAEGSRFDFVMGYERISDVRLALAGTFQIENASLAIAAALTLREHFSIPIKETLLKKGLASALWPGRFEIIRKWGKTFVLDGAHNEESMAALGKSIKACFPGRDIVTVFGVSRGKRADVLLRLAERFSRMIILTKSSHPRAALPKNVLESSQVSGPKILTGDIREAFQRLRGMSSPRTVVVVTGSLFLVGEARQLLKGTTEK